jgi:alpha-D-ribose 1-methylphosphonate 5-triphosphate diphosphatase
MWLENLKIVLPDAVLDRGAIGIEAGQIVEVREGDAPTRDAFNGAGLWALPGLVDLHGDMIEREIEPRPDSFFPVELALRELDKRLAATGITTAYAAFSFVEWSLQNKQAAAVRIDQTVRRMIHEINALRPTLLTDLRIHARFEITYPNAIPVLEELIAEGQIQMVSLMDHTPGQGQYRDLESYVAYISRWLNTDRTGVEESMRRLLANKGQALNNLWEVGGFARRHGLVLASHDDDTVEKVQLMAEVGTSFSEFPITLAAAQAAKERGMWVAMGGPNALRGKSHSGNLLARDVLQAGLLDILMTDYYPAAPLHAALRWVEEGLVTLPQAAALIATNPAQAAGLADRGRIGPGTQADLVLVKPGATPQVAATLRQGRFIYRAELA